MAILSGLEELAMAEKTFNINERGSQAVDKSEALEVRQLWRVHLPREPWLEI